MASGVFKKTMVYLGLVDDEYDEADGYEPWAPQTTRQATRVATEEPEEPRLHRLARRSGLSLVTNQLFSRSDQLTTFSRAPDPLRFCPRCPSTRCRTYGIHRRQDHRRQARRQPAGDNQSATRRS